MNVKASHPVQKILITGGAGYIGIKLTARLLVLGHQVTIFDNFMYGYDSVLHLFPNKKLSVIKGDIRSEIDNLSDFDVIYHLAGISGFPACAANPHSAQLINVDATKKILSGLGKGQIFINASTTSLYGKSSVPCYEDSEVSPVSTYAMTKYAAEKIVAENQNSVNLRFATIFGLSSRMRMDLMVNDFTYTALKERVLVLFDGFAKRSFMHIDDAVDCYIFTLNNYEIMKGGIFNAGGNNLNYSKREIAELIKKRIDFQIVDSELKDKDLRHYVINYDKIKKLGFEPKKSIEQGIDEMLQVFTYYEYYSHFKPI